MTKADIRCKILGETVSLPKGFSSQIWWTHAGRVVPDPLLPLLGSEICGLLGLGDDTTRI
jgi:hypothetical protein